MIRICTSDPSVLRPDGTTVEVKETAGVLLRMLLLSRNPKIPADGAAAVMGIMPSGFGQYVAQLRQCLGDQKLVVRSNGFVRYTGDRNDSDAAVITELHTRIIGQIEMVEDLSDETITHLLPDLERIADLYKGNPAMGLAGFEMRSIPDHLHAWAMELDDLVSEWMDRWSSMQLLLAQFRLRLSPNRQTGKQVFTELVKIARIPDPEEEVFPLLLHAAKVSQDIKLHRTAWDLAQAFYLQENLEPPAELLAFAPPPQRRGTPWTPNRAKTLTTPLEAPAETGDTLREIARLLGITTDSALSMRGAEIEPVDCISRTTRRLYFSGILASKWVVGAGVRYDFDQLLTRLDNLSEPVGDVRFMIIDPEGDAYEHLFQLRGGRLSKESVPYLRDLASRHRSFQVRTVDALPAFRIVVIDDDVVSFSPYALEGERYATSKLGWEAPHVLLDPLAPYPLADAFRLYFEERWLAAKPL